MRKSIGAVAAAAVAVAVILVVLPANGAGAAVSSYTVALAGTNVVPPAENGYTGSATMTIDADTFEICIQVTTDIPDSDLPTERTTISEGAAGVNGAPVVDFEERLDTCVTSDAATVGSIEANPGGFYLEVQTDEFFEPSALRGQLVLVPTTTTTTAPSTTTTTTVPSTTTTTTPGAPPAEPVVGPAAFTG
jgi:hypothetical protein